MKKVYFLFAILFFISCKKETDNKGNQAYRKFDTVGYSCGIPIVYKTNYDGDRLVSLISEGPAFDVKYYFIYNSEGRLIQRDRETHLGRQKLTEYRYDNAGQVIEKKDLFPVCLGMQDCFKYIFAYENGKLTETTSYLKSDTISDYIFYNRQVFSWAGENIRLVTSYNIYNSPFPEAFDITYDLTKPNPMLIFKDFWLQDIYENSSTAYYLLSKNLIKTMRTPSADCVVNFTYDSTFNEKRVKSLGSTCNSNTIWNFTYTQ